NNFWVEYFLQCNMHGDENWIDFESEISNVVKAIDNQMHEKDRKSSLYDKLKEWTDNFSRIFFEKEYGKEVTYKEIRDKLEKDLNKLIRLFEIYLVDYVEKMDVTIISPDIKEIVQCSGAVRGVKTNLYSKVLSFNYTNTYERVYWDEKKYICKCSDYMDYIHGKAQINNKIESNNIVLGIDEYLGRKKRDKYVEFIAFKKFYQRIHKKTGCKYKEWVEAIQKDIKKENAWTYDNHEYFKDRFYNLFFFGHSLDITDKDILRDLILNDNVHTTIFYHDKDTMGQQIANLVKVIGQDELIRRTGGSTKTIEFKLQKPMEVIKKDS
ncbi:MAG: bacteriophage abortive infection AbiH family protein, partial [Lachnospiraceae bacterium]|nr:bacteriophage abortive infection AbiH family protein [Lachnospiraceae bacterium]